MHEQKYLQSNQVPKCTIKGLLWKKKVLFSCLKRILVSKGDLNSYRVKKKKSCSFLNLIIFRMLA